MWSQEEQKIQDLSKLVSSLFSEFENLDQKTLEMDGLVASLGQEVSTKLMQKSSENPLAQQEAKTIDAEEPSKVEEPINKTEVAETTAKKVPDIGDGPPVINQRAKNARAMLKK